ncbi:hypothetical protein SLEP1_g2774 [Rubroshorea leprosula]|uniref:Uncharacterized protein n=1 Tax=Rubroshorea leprosula TaxID=152421 RepID=A0AAV5HI92_9ROSI|nr:hypothetical protein SLEP1_g2774 [Rubroshorea leprosula]
MLEFDISITIKSFLMVLCLIGALLVSILAFPSCIHSEIATLAKTLKS